MKPIKLTDNTISLKHIHLLINWLKKNPKLTKGKLTIKFENLFSKWINRKYSIFVNSGSSANLLIAQGLLEANMLRNKIAIAPAVSWVTTVTPFMQMGYDVKLCDCDKHNLGLDIKHLEELCKKYRPSVLILVHVLGHANDMDNILRICKRYNIKIIEDTCEALGSTYGKKKLGTQGLASSFSFYYGHHISTIEGGMLTLDDKKLYNVLMSIRSHGWGRDLESTERKRLEKKFNIDKVRSLYSFYYSGFNLRSTDLNAFIGIQQMKVLNNKIKTRFRNFKIFSKYLSNFWTQKSNTKIVSNFGYGMMVKNRTELFDFLKKNRIESRPLICGNMGQQPFWIKKYKKPKLPNAEKIHKYGLYLPNHENLTEKQVKYICDKVNLKARSADFN
ncbi:DegT/DnrJ/EryC1/StrS family aminotransferase [Candidatus Pelagibacter sp.]|jgi:CDP-6-deoxy-D-xylo-4-hexulose-3-dehydrase|nr:DegT/DnrJ/EryC1/StrS family aminotransferase [Candidatus Pelagibacter sp.]|tara:strand:+ start:2116 stop:3282 length:1167 start_codon:yes stop_codon:yes gene_type:complete